MLTVRAPLRERHGLHHRDDGDVVEDERQRRAEVALISVVATCYLLGVSTRRMDRLVHTLGVTRLSKSQVSEMAKSLDAAVEAFRTRPLDAGPHTFGGAALQIYR